MAWHRTLYATAVALAMAGCASTDDDAASCDRACLVEFGREVALGTRTLTDSVRFTENGASVRVTESWLELATNVDVHGEYAAENTVIVIGTGTDDDGRPSVFGLRLRLESKDAKEAELIITHEGEVSLFPPATPLARQAVFSELVPASMRSERARMIEIADAYFDGIEVDSGANVPITDDCNRVENGVQVTNSERFTNIKCNSLEPFDYITEVRERRYPVVDLEHGVVVGLVAFYIPGGDYERTTNGMKTIRHYDPRSLFLIEGFKIIDDKVRLIQATMHNMPLGSSMGWPEK